MPVCAGAGTPHSSAADARCRTGIVAGITGILCNIFLFAVKIAVGIFSGSIAVLADAVNNLSDAGSCVVTLVGFKMASRPADDEHPFGHGRVEYISGLIVAIIVVAVGLDFLKSSLIRLFSPAPTGAAPLGIILLSLALPVKLWMFFFYRRMAAKIDSSALKATAFDSLSDILVTSVVVVSMLLEYFFTWHCDGIAGTAVSLFVLHGGVAMIKETISPLLGEAPKDGLAEKVVQQILENPDVMGVHELVMHNYGPGRYFATAHAEVSRDVNPVEIHDSLEKTEETVAKVLPVRLVLHCDPFDSTQLEYKKWRLAAVNAALNVDHRMRVYDFRYRQTGGAPQLSFHLLSPREFPDSEADLREKILKKLQQSDPAVIITVTIDHSFV